MPESDDTTGPRLRLNINVERPTSESMRLKALHVALRSTRGDVIYDTITDLGGTLSGPHVVLNPPADQGQVLTPRYDLPRDGHWMCELESIDIRDSVINHEQCDLGVLEPAEIRDLPLQLAARVAAYEGVFEPRASTPDQRAITVKTFEMDVDGQTYCAADLDPAAQNSSVRIACEYLPTGSREVTTRVYGTLGDDATTRLLWEGRRQVDIKAGAGATTPIPMVWSLPDDALAKSRTATQSAEMDTELRLGRVGHVVMNVTMSAAVIL